MSRVYGVSTTPATGDREERRRLHEMMTGDGAVAGLNLPKIEDAIARAPRKKKDAAGKQRTIGPKVAKMVKKLLMLEGKGEAAGDWIHKTRREWTTGEVPLTPGELRTARRVAEEEGLIEQKEDLRPSDGRNTIFYRVDMWEVARVVVRSELERYRDLLAHERRTAQIDTYEKRIEELWRAGADLAMVDGESTGAPGQEPGPPNPKAVEGVQTLQRGGDNSASLHRGTDTRVPSTDGSLEKTLAPDGTSVGSGRENAASAPPKGNKGRTSGTFRPEVEETMRVIYARLKAAGIEKVPRWRYAGMKCDLDRHEYPADDPALLAELLVEHHEETGEVDHVGAWLPVAPRFLSAEEATDV